jgi:hypothetical protein
MMELVFVACLGAQPPICETKAMQFSDMSAMACTMCAQQVLAQWGNEHPNWQIQRWTCQPVGSERSA